MEFTFPFFETPPGASAETIPQPQRGSLQTLQRGIGGGVVRLARQEIEIVVVK